MSRLFCREMLDKSRYKYENPVKPVMFATNTLHNIGFTLMTSFPLQLSRLASTSLGRSAAPVRSDPPLETVTSLPRERRTDRQRQRRSSLSAMNAGGLACPETRPCPHPSPGGRKPVQTLAGKADGMDVLLGNVEPQHRDAAQLNTSANAYAERWVRQGGMRCASRQYGAPYLLQRSQFLSRGSRRLPHAIL